MSRRRRTWGGLAVAACCLLSPVAAGPRSWVAGPELLAQGQADGVAVSRRGRLFAAPRVRPVGDQATPGGPVHAWALTADEQGRLYLGTGPDGQIVRVAPSGTQSLVFAIDEPLVTALAVRPGGELLAAGAPGGRIYRIGADGVGTVWAETGARYVWELIVAADGTTLAAVGEPGAVLRIDASGAVETLFESDEAHIVFVTALAGGELLVGGSGRGGVYRVDAEGHALALYDDELDEAVAAVELPDGTVVAALQRSPAPRTPVPELRLRLPDGVEVGAESESLGALEPSRGPLLRGVIEGLEGPLEPRARPLRGRVVRIAPTGEVDSVWESAAEAPYCLVVDPAGRVLFGTGEPGRVYRIEPDGDLALLATLREAQVTAFRNVGQAVFLATSNPAVAYRLERDTAKPAGLLVPAFDAGAPARWGSIRWRPEGAGERVEVYTRTGNSPEPDRTWSAWGPLARQDAGSPIENPDGRYVQWRVRFAPGAAVVGVSGVELSYEPLNRPPRVEEFRLDPPAAAVSGAASFRWLVVDPDDDPIELIVEQRPAGEEAWRPATQAAAAPAAEGGRGAQSAAWDTAGVDEGPYEIRALANDAAGHPPGEGRRVEARPRLRLIVDRTPPVLEPRAGGGAIVELTARDAHSAVARVELLREGRRRNTLRPDDGVCDSSSETFRVELPAGEGWSVRAVDAAGNAAEIPLPGAS